MIRQPGALAGGGRLGPGAGEQHLQRAGVAELRPGFLGAGVADRVDQVSGLGEAQAGAGEILLTSMDRDGTKSGYDLALCRAVAEAVPVPVIASGGGGTPESLAAALDDGPEGGHCQAALAASIFHFREISVGELKLRLHELGIPVRLPSGPEVAGTGGLR